MVGRLDKSVTTPARGDSLSIDDMLDGYDIRQWPDQFGQVISYIHATLYEDYLKHDTDSLHQQARHRWASGIAIGAGTIAILLSLVGVFLEAKGGALGINFSRDYSSIFRIFQLASFSIAIGVKIVGLLYKHWHQNWLVERFCAEEYRTQKFRALLQKTLFCNPEKPWSERYSLWKTWFDNQADTLKNRTKRGVQQCLLENNVSPPTPGTLKCNFDEVYLGAMLNYYMDKRLVTQLHYFERRSEQLERQGDRFRGILTSVFYLGIIFVFFQLIIDYSFLKSSTIFHYVSLALLLIVLTLPILAFALRTLRSSTEVARNASLYRSNHTTLDNFRLLLVVETKRDVRNWQEIVEIIWECENHLEDVNREWIRIMNEAEWFI